MKMLRDVCIEIQRAMLEPSQQLLEVAFEMEERYRLRLAMQTQRRQVASGRKREAASLVMTVAQLLKNFTRLEQPNIARSAIQVVANHVEQSGCERVAHVA